MFFLIYRDVLTPMIGILFREFLKVMIGDKDCDVTPGFVLYLTTKLSNPAYSPEVILLLQFWRTKMRNYRR